MHAWSVGWCMHACMHAWRVGWCMHACMHGESGLHMHGECGLYMRGGSGARWVVVECRRYGTVQYGTVRYVRACMHMWGVRRLVHT
jgi:hypothetical protein